MRRAPLGLIAMLALSAAACGEDSGGDDPETSIDFSLDEEASGYEELVPMLQDMGAMDGNGHLDQRVISEWAGNGATEDQLAFLFDHGDELTEIEFTAADGIGALDTTNRFARHPTNDRFTGPNARSCGACHDQPLGNGGGRNVANVVQDPQPEVEGDFNVRNTRNINGDAWLQLAGVEMTMDLQAQRDALRDSVSSTGNAGAVQLSTKGVDFGTLTCSPGEAGAVACDYGAVSGVSPDLVVRSQGWKGNFTTVRAFSEDAFFGEMGLTSDRFVYHVSSPGSPVPNDVDQSPPDIDQDGIANEMSVGDVTAMTIYLAAQAPPTTLLQLAEEGKVDLSQSERTLIEDGRDVFMQTGCNGCHAMALPVQSPIFREPDARATSYYDFLLADSNNGYEPSRPVTLDLSSSPIVERYIAAETDAQGVTSYPVEAMTDLKRHFLGEHLCDDAKLHPAINAAFVSVGSPSDAEQVMEMGIDRCEFLTADLWGIGGTAPYMHDGRSATLAEAIVEHCTSGGSTGEGDASCRNFLNLPGASQAALVAFLKNQVMEPEEEEE